MVYLSLARVLPAVYSPTIESTFRKSIRWRGEEMVLSIRDTSGQDEHTVFHARNCTGVHGFMYVHHVAMVGCVASCRR